MFQSLCFTYTGSVSISYFKHKKAGRGLLNLQNLHRNIVGVIINKFPTAIPYFSRFILDSDFGFKYFLKIVCTKIINNRSESYWK